MVIQRAVKTTIQIRNDRGLFDKYAEEVLQNFLFVTRPRADLEEVNDNDV